MAADLMPFLGDPPALSNRDSHAHEPIFKDRQSPDKLHSNTSSTAQSEDNFSN